MTLRFISGSDYDQLAQYYIGAASMNDTHALEMPNVSQQFYYLITTGAGAPSGSVWVQAFKLPMGGE